MKKILAILLILVLAVPCALAEGDTWTCPGCGQAGTTGNFCNNCGTQRPSGEWNCAACGQAGNTGKYCSNCGAAKPGGNAAVEARTVDEGLEQIRGVEDKVKICLSGVTASDYIVNNSFPDRWIPEHATDGDESTCWQVSAKNDPKGKVWLQLDIPGERTVDEIWFKNGFWAYNDMGDDEYHMNARLKSVRVSFLYAGETKYRDETEVKLRDEVFTGWQQYPVGKHEHVVSVKVAVWTKVKGKKYPNDVCLSEVMLVQNAPAAIAKEPPAEKEATVYESRPEVSGVYMKDALATRSGPGKEYESTATFFSKDWKTQRVRVLGKAWDSKHQIWWCQVEVFYKGTPRWVWTGSHRLIINLEMVKEIKKSGTCHVDATEAYCGPGTNYMKLGDVLFFEDEIDFYRRENGFVEIDYYDVNREIQRRCWVSESAVSNMRR